MPIYSPAQVSAIFRVDFRIVGELSNFLSMFSWGWLYNRIETLRILSDKRLTDRKSLSSTYSGLNEHTVPSWVGSSTRRMVVRKTGYVNSNAGTSQLISWSWTRNVDKLFLHIMSPLDEQIRLPLARVKWQKSDAAGKEVNYKIFTGRPLCLQFNFLYKKDFILHAKAGIR